MAFSTRGMIPCHPQGLPVDGYVRYNVLYLTRTARAHLQLGDLDAAAEASTQNATLNSSRPTDALGDLDTEPGSPLACSSGAGLPTAHPIGAAPEAVPVTRGRVPSGAQTPNSRTIWWDLTSGLGCVGTVVHYSCTPVLRSASPTLR